MAPQVGLEPTTLRLTAGCSAIELLRSGVKARAGRGLGVYHSIPVWGVKIVWDTFVRGTLRRRLAHPCMGTYHAADLYYGRVLSGSEVFMSVVRSMVCLGLVVGTICAGEGQVGTSGPPKAEVRVLSENWHGTKIVDNYRWLEDGSSADTRKWVAEEMAYTRGVLDPLPGREAIQKRLTDLLHIGDVGVPKIGGKFYFYTRRDGLRNQPVLYVREGIDGKDRVLVDVNLLAADGTVALDWFWPAEHGKYLAYGTSSSGSEMSTLHIVETKTGNLLPDTIERTRAASIAWKHDNSGFYYTRYPKKGDVAEGQEMYNRHVFYHALGNDPAKDTLIFGEGRDPEDWPSVSLSNDGRWLLINVSEGWTKSELFLMDLKSGHPPSVVTRGKDFLYSGEVYATDAGAKLFITTNEDAPRYRVFVTDPENYERESWKEIIPQSDAVLQGVAVYGGNLLAQYEQNATSQLKIFDLEGKKISD